MSVDDYFEVLEPDETVQEQRFRLAVRDRLRERMAEQKAIQNDPLPYLEPIPYRPDLKTWQESLSCYTKHMPQDPEAFRKWESEGQQEYVKNLE